MSTTETGRTPTTPAEAPTSWRLRIRHRTTFRYDGPVAASYNEVRLTPSSADGQLVISSRIDVRPTARLEAYTDYWGTTVHAFDVHVPHAELVVTALSLVDTVPERPRAPGCSWDELRDPAVFDAHFEYLAARGPVTMGPELAEATAAVRAAPDPATAVTTALDLVTDRLSYVSGTTDVSTTDVEAWNHRAGVCQDYSHLSIALLRGAGIPARYSSGYLHPGDGDIAQTVVGESHAWIEAWLGGWEAHDPTNRRPVAERHVLVARGRDYTDVPPVKGIFSGGGSEDSEVVVELTRQAR